jgi:hypothetical protein
VIVEASAPLAPAPLPADAPAPQEAVMTETSLDAPLAPAPMDPVLPPGPPAQPAATPSLPDVPAPVYDAANQAMTTGEVPAAGVPHLVSPTNLPPGTTEDRSQLPSQGRNLTYIKELWHAIQTQDVSVNDAILGFAQRPLDSAPSPGGLPADPQAAPAPAPIP